MAIVRGRIQQAQINIMHRAAERWLARRSEREAGLREVERHGVGAADTSKRQIEFAQRMRQSALRPLMLDTREAIIGSNDLVRFAPSEVSRRVARPVARIVNLPGGDYAPEGIATGFLVTGTGLLMTNYHVFPAKSDTRGRGANFRHEEDEHGVAEGQYFEFDADRFFVSNEALDFAIVALKPAGLKGADLASIGWTRLIEATGKVMTGEPLNIIQHPDGGPRRFAIKNNQLVDILPQGFVHYEGDTKRGSSGSPVLSTRWELVALHHSAVPLMANGVPQTTRGTAFDPDNDDLDSVKWIANEGTRVSFIVEALRQQRLDDGAQQQLLADLLASTADPLAAGPLPPAPPGAATNLGMAPVMSGATGHSFNISGPTTIHVYGPSGPGTGPTPAAEPSPVRQEFAEEKALVFDPDYAARQGYDPSFLGPVVPLPRVTDARLAELYSVADYRAFYAEFRDVPEIDTAREPPEAPFVLDYHHYSLAFNKRFFMCMWTASNCDYRGLMRQDTRKRSDLGGESWRPDPRVPPALQLLDRDIYSPARRIDRGHVVRREDNCWGPAGLDTDYANSDTYHFTNCTPQHEAFNQENPSDKRKVRQFDYSALGVHGLWGQFESAVEGQLKAGGGVATLFAGPVLSNFFDSRDWGTGEVKIPRKFWKVVVVPEGRGRQAKLLAYGYLFDQSDVARRFNLSYEALELPQFERKRATLAEISRLSGVTFADVVLEAEQAP